MPTPVETQPTQESVWDYPRPPRVEPTAKHIRVVFNGQTVAETTRALRVLETSQPPAYYIPRDDVRWHYLRPAGHATLCEFKGLAAHWTLLVDDQMAAEAAWSYPDPTPDYAELQEHVAFYASRVEACYVDGEQVTPQPGKFYGGWITSDISGPFKGERGSENW